MLKNDLTLMENQLLNSIAVYFPFSPEDICALYFRTNKSFDITIFLCNYLTIHGLSSIEGVPTQLLEDLLACSVNIPESEQKREG